MPIVAAAREVEIGGSWLKAQANLSETLSQKTCTSWLLWFISIIPATWKSEMGESQFKTL
jgi:hypothetical protein